LTEATLPVIEKKMREMAKRSSLSPRDHRKAKYSTSSPSEEPLKRELIDEKSRIRPASTTSTVRRLSIFVSGRTSRTRETWGI
jgi:threonyl-tRNA synthetase